jgi:hypothetical protein
MWFKWQSTCLASARPEFKVLYCQKNTNKDTEDELSFKGKKKNSLFLALGFSYHMSCSGKAVIPSRLLPVSLNLGVKQLSSDSTVLWRGRHGHEQLP